MYPSAISPVHRIRPLCIHPPKTKNSYVEGGRFFAGLAKDARPVFSGTGAMNSQALILVSMLSTAFVAHFNAPKFYTDLKDKSVPR